MRSVRLRIHIPRKRERETSEGSTVSRSTRPDSSWGTSTESGGRGFTGCRTPSSVSWSRDQGSQFFCHSCTCRRKMSFSVEDLRPRRRDVPPETWGLDFRWSPNVYDNRTGPEGKDPTSLPKRLESLKEPRFIISTTGGE